LSNSKPGCRVSALHFFGMWTGEKHNWVQNSKRIGRKMESSSHRTSKGWYLPRRTPRQPLEEKHSTPSWSQWHDCPIRTSVMWKIEDERLVRENLLQAARNISVRKKDVKHLRGDWRLETTSQRRVRSTKRTASLDGYVCAAVPTRRSNGRRLTRRGSHAKRSAPSPPNTAETHTHPRSTETRLTWRERVLWQKNRRSE
jgi:hypothetical protein